ncbi:hypothetical protein AQ490_23225 [Wenjunlia vitaminophila]|uniref:Uncharacterized protein n=1 Tax=Wenjunlia vitaminophila TaxID=76728 RepID=A0A0T6LSJ1_WENVI|nr:hypothetical protein [Wenjunlia vitaminophila]KRV48786.1 hypothetical protein AQ490_23225 [Wenjunlia vitaminophila]
MYCTIAEARDAGTTGTDAEVTAWIEAAQDRITQYTRQVFEPTILGMVVDVGAGGVALLPRRVRTITSVTPVGVPDTPALPSSSYVVTSSSVLGQVDAVRLRVGGWNDLVAGAESYNGGWLGLWERSGATQVRVDGEFGYDTVPLLVARACALLAADLQAATEPDDPDAPDDGLSVDDEGNNVAITPDNADDTADDDGRPTTGSPRVDKLLAGFMNLPPVLEGV